MQKFLSFGNGCERGCGIECARRLSPPVILLLDNVGSLQDLLERGFVQNWTCMRMCDLRLHLGVYPPDRPVFEILPHRGAIRNPNIAIPPSEPRF